MLACCRLAERHGAAALVHDFQFTYAPTKLANGPTHACTGTQARMATWARMRVHARVHTLGPHKTHVTGQGDSVHIWLITDARTVGRFSEQHRRHVGRHSGLVFSVKIVGAHEAEGVACAVDDPVRCVERQEPHFPLIPEACAAHMSAHLCHNTRTHIRTHRHAHTYAYCAPAPPDVHGACPCTKSHTGALCKIG